MSKPIIQVLISKTLSPIEGTGALRVTAVFRSEVGKDSKPDLGEQLEISSLV